MRRMIAGFWVAVLATGIAGSTRAARGDERPKGPDEDGTKPALVQIAGEGEMNSHAFQ